MWKCNKLQVTWSIIGKIYLYFPRQTFDTSLNNIPVQALKIKYYILILIFILLKINFYVIIGKRGWVLRGTVVEVACPSQPRARSCVVEHETNYELDLSRWCQGNESGKTIIRTVEPNRRSSLQLYTLCRLLWNG